MRTSASTRAPQTPTVNELDEARRRFQEYEPRDLFYRVATELIELALAGETRITVPEALAVLLQTWNAQYYQYRPFTEQHFREIEQLLETHLKTVLSFRDRSIESVSQADLKTVEALFDYFEQILGPVGAAKSLHLLGPNFFPLWDREIARCHRCDLNKVGNNGANYMAFFLLTLQQVRTLLPLMADGAGLLKKIDEYNYCKYTKRWM
jgi:hypothetical protein